MSLQSKAQFQSEEMIHPADDNSASTHENHEHEEHKHNEHEEHDHEDLVVVEDANEEHNQESGVELVVVDGEPVVDIGKNNPEIMITISDLGAIPGAPEHAADDSSLEIHESDDDADELQAKDNKVKKNEKWDWESKGAKGFLEWVKERFDSVPKHSGFDSAGLERACAYLEKLDNEISQAMRKDLDGELDADKVEEVRAKIDDGLERLETRISKVRKKTKVKRKKKAEDMSPEMIKEAQKITGVQGTFVTVDILLSRIARVCINGMVSSGHDIEDLFEKQAKFYKLDEREKASVMQLLSDMGHQMRQDRGYGIDQDVDTRSSNNMDWQANYPS